MLGGRYRITSRLGKGGMGEVYRADDLKLAHVVALKFLPEQMVADPIRLSRFHHEVKIARQLCVGLAAAHDKGVLHRDLKPANVMLDGEGRVRVTDFGLTALAGEVQEAESRSGTPTYMAPEQLAGKEVSVASDLYALGLVLFELFTGKAAFRADSLPELMRLHAESGPASPSSLVHDLDPAVERVILRCLAKHPTERPTSALAVAAALPGGDPLAAARAGHGGGAAGSGGSPPVPPRRPLGARGSGRGGDRSHIGRLGAASGGRRVQSRLPRVGNPISSFAGILFTATLFYLIYLAMEPYVRRRWAAIAAMMLFFGGTGFFVGDHWSQGVRQVLFVGLGLLLLMRVGLLAAAAASFVRDLLAAVPLTLDFSHWYAYGTALAFAALAAVAGYAFHTALAGRPLFGDRLLDE